MPQSANTVRVVARITARREHVSEVRDILEGLVGPTRAERGCLGYELLHNSRDPTDFTFVEEWSDPAALDAHASSPHFLDAYARLPELLDGPVDIRRYSLIK